MAPLSYTKADVRRTILSCDFIGRQKIGRFLYDTRAIKLPILSAIISAVELGCNFGVKIARFYQKSRDKIARLTSA